MWKNFVHCTKFAQKDDKKQYNFYTVRTLFSFPELSCEYGKIFSQQNRLEIDDLKKGKMLNTKEDLNFPVS